MQNHGVGVIPPAPGVRGGSAARFSNGENWLEVPHDKSLMGMMNTSSITFWGYFERVPEKEASTFDCPIAYFGGPTQSVFSVTWNAAKGRMGAERYSGALSVKSRAKPRAGSWHHFAVTFSATGMKLYTNGILDAYAVSDKLQRPTLKHPSFFAGSTPFLATKDCKVTMHMDELRLYDRVLRDDEIEAESFPALGSVEPYFVRLGCERCVFDHAFDSCPAPYYLCDKNGLESGALQAARKMGWRGPFWTNDAGDNKSRHKGQPGDKKTALCCYS